MYQIEIPTTKPYELMLGGDMHIGHEQTDYVALKRVRRWLLRKPKSRGWGGTGDYMEAVLPIRSPPGAIWSQEIDPGEQYDWITEFFEPVPPKWLMKGNHENRILNTTGINITRMMAKKFDCLYAHIGGYIKIIIGEEPYLFYVRHGYGRSETPEYLLLKVIRKRRVRCDVIALGHMHLLRRYKYWMDLPEGFKLMYGLRTGGFLSAPDYAEERIMEPAEVGVPIIKMWPNKYKIRVDVDTRIP